MSTATSAAVVQEAERFGRKPGRRVDEIVRAGTLAEGVYELVIRDAYVARNAKPAQFVNLYPADASLLLPRPFGVAEVTGDEVTLIYQVAGAGTRQFTQLAAGDAVDVLGPLGKPFDLDKSANYVLVGGGLGIPPVMLAAQALSVRDDVTVTTAFGYRNERFADDLVAQYVDAPHSITNEEGNVIDLLDSIVPELEAAAKAGRPPIVLSCGPTPMMKAVAQWGGRHGAEVQLSLEARMGCGYGACVACVVDTPQGRLKVCKDGPVFTSEQLGWVV
nr:dihydroorotate dehydrogenase electron transfer subunit [Bifidobacterium bohemicum]